MQNIIKGAYVLAILGLLTLGAGSAWAKPAVSPTDAPASTKASAAAQVPGAAPAAPTSAAGPVEVAQKSDRVYRWRMVSSLSAKNPNMVRLAKMVDRIKERTRGAVTITIFPKNTLMKTPDVPKAVRGGTIEMDAIGLAFYGGVSDIAAILAPGFVGISTTDIMRMLQAGSEGRKLVDEHFAQLRIKPLVFWNQADIGFVTFAPMNTVASFKGKKLRVSNETAALVLRALGAEPTVMGGAEAVDAMRRGIIDGSTCQPTCIVSRGYLDFAKSYNPWTVVPFVGMLTINLKVWNSLPANIQKIIQEEADAAGKYNTELVATLQGETMWNLALENGMSLMAIAPAERAKLQAIAKPIYDDFVKNARPQPLATRAAELLLQAVKKR